MEVWRDILVKKFPAFFLSEGLPTRNFQPSMNPRVHYRVHKSQKKPTHKLTLYSFKVQFCITFPSTLTSPEWCLPSDFPTKILYEFLISSERDTNPDNLIILDLIIYIRKYVSRD